MRLIGLLRSGHDETVGVLEESDRAEVGFAINGLADLTVQLLEAEQTLADAEPIVA